MCGLRVQRATAMLVVLLGVDLAACTSSGGSSISLPDPVAVSNVERAVETARRPRIEGFAIPTISAVPTAIAEGSDGNMWFVERDAGKVARITKFGVISEFSIGSGTGPTDIIRGPDGNLWITLRGVGEIAKCTTAGLITRYGSGTGPFPSAPFRLAAGLNNDIWFTDIENNDVVEMATSGSVLAVYHVSGTASVASEPFDITVGPDRKIWFTELLQNKIGRINPNGTVTEFATGPDQNGQSSNPAGIRGVNRSSLIISRPYRGDLVRMRLDGTIVASYTNSGSGTPGSQFIELGKKHSDELWLGDGHLQSFDLETNEYSAFITSPSGVTTDVYDLSIARDGNVWYVAPGENSIVVYHPQ